MHTTIPVTVFRSPPVVTAPSGTDTIRIEGDGVCLEMSERTFWRIVKRALVAAAERMPEVRAELGANR